MVGWEGRDQEMSMLSAGSSQMLDTSPNHLDLCVTFLCPLLWSHHGALRQNRARNTNIAMVAGIQVEPSRNTNIAMVAGIQVEPSSNVDSHRNSLSLFQATWSDYHGPLSETSFLSACWRSARGKLETRDG